MGLHDFTVYSLFQRNAAVNGRKVGWVCGPQQLTHRRFREEADQLAAGLRAAGLGKGDRLAVISKNNLKYALLFGAAARLGAVVVPINWRLSQDEIEFMLTDSDPKALFVESDFQESIGALADRLNRGARFFSFDAPSGIFESFDQLAKCPAPPPEIEVTAQDDFVILYTAAVDVKPRGATLSHAGLLAANAQYMYYWHLTTDDVHLAMLPLFHIVALGMALAVNQAGGTNVILPKFEPAPALRHIQDNRVTLFGSFPPLIENLIAEAEKDSYDLTSVRIILGLDHPERIKKFQAMTGGAFWTAFGQSETSGLVTLGPYDQKPGSAGTLGYMSEVAIVDDQDRLAPCDQAGEIVVRGSMVMNGYWNRPADNELTFQNGWHHTGDLGRIDEQGFLYYLGRTPRKELIKPGGENVYPAEVERVIGQHPLVAEVCVIGVPDSQWGEAVKAVVRLKPGSELTENELIEFVAGRIARYKKPKYVTFTSELPKTAAGSIDRPAVKTRFGQA